MKHKKQVLILSSIVAIIAVSQCTKSANMKGGSDEARLTEQSKINERKPSLIENGKQIFRFDAFGDEDFWSGLLHIDKAIAGSKNGGFGAGVSPKTALAVGLKVDAEALPRDVVSGIKSGTVDLNDPATTLALLKMNAVVG